MPSRKKPVQEAATTSPGALRGPMGEVAWVIKDTVLQYRTNEGKMLKHGRNRQAGRVQDLHEDDRGGHLLGLVVEKRVHVPLVVANQREPEVRDESRRLVHEEMSEDQGAKHLQSSNAFLGAPFVEGPGVVLSRDLVVEPEDLRLGGGVHVGEPSADIGIAIIRCTSVTSP